MSSNGIFTASVFNTLKPVLEAIVDDKRDNVESSLVWPMYADKKKQTDHYEDFLEMSGPSLASEKEEMAPITVGGIQEGAITRFLLRTFALKLIFSEEVIEDTKYPKALDGAKRLKRAMFKTQDYDMASILIRAFNSSYVGGDGQPLISASHTLPNGGSWSNLAATAMSPSTLALSIATSAIRKFPGHDGTIEGQEPKKVVHPTEQWAKWAGILDSKMDPEPGNFAKVNVIRSLGITPVPVKYWTNTTTNWLLLTECEYGLCLRQKYAPRSNSWRENDNMVMKFSVAARWSRGWVDARCAYGVNA
jgi:hypothetical protein